MGRRDHRSRLQLCLSEFTARKCPPAGHQVSLNHARRRRAATALTLCGTCSHAPARASCIKAAFKPSHTRMSARSKSNSSQSKSNDPKRGSVRALMTLNFFIADVQNGMGAFVALYLMAGVGWNPGQIGAALAAGSIAQVLAQTPAGVLIDQLRQKRAMLIIGAVMIAIGCLSIALLSTLAVVTAGQAMIGIAGPIFPPCLAAIALGLVGRKRMDRQMGTNQAFNAAGNMSAAIVFGLVGYFLGLKWMFYLVVVFVVIAIVCVLRIKASDIDFDLARGADAEGAAPNECTEKPKGIWSGLKDLLLCFGQLFKQKAVLVFLVSAVIFHFANAAMVPLGIGAFLSNSVAGYIAHRAGANAAFYVLGGIATAGLIFFWLLMPATKDIAHGKQAAA